MSNEQMSLIQPTAEIPVERLPELRTKLESLNKKATKLGTPSISLRVGEPFDRNIDGLIYSYVPVTVTGEAPRLNGWVFVATLEHDENGTIIRRIPTFSDEIDLTQYREATPENCDHCGYKRRRNDTYIVAHRINLTTTRDFETKQVGSNCLKDFTGHESPQAVARFMEQVRDFIESVEGGSYDGGHITARYHLNQVLAVAAHVVAKTGYVSRRKFDETGEMPTAEVVRDEFFIRQRKSIFERGPLEYTLDIDAVIEWVRSLTDSDLENDYLYNLYTVCKGDSITSRQFVIAASAIPAYQRAMQKERARKASNRVDEFVGEKGDKIDIEFKVFRIFENPGDFGVSYKHIMRATTGHTFTWRTSGDPLEEGKSYKATFTIKDHYEGKNGKETQVWRPNKKTMEEIS